MVLQNKAQAKYIVLIVKNFKQKHQSYFGFQGLNIIILLKRSLSLNSVQLRFYFISFSRILTLFHYKINKCSFSVGLLDIIKTLKKTTQSKYITLYYLYLQYVNM